VTLVKRLSTNMSWPRDLISKVTTHFSIRFLLIILRKSLRNPVKLETYILTTVRGDGTFVIIHPLP
jgi:hypothetical protein